MNTTVKLFFNKFANTLANLKSRWSQESQYEDFNDYIDVVKKSLPRDIQYVSLSRAFCLTFNHAGTRYQMKVTRNQVSLLILQ